MWAGSNETNIIYRSHTCNVLWYADGNHVNLPPSSSSCSYSIWRERFGVVMMLAGSNETIIIYRNHTCNVFWYADGNHVDLPPSLVSCSYSIDNICRILNVTCIIICWRERFGIVMMWAGSNETNIIYRNHTCNVLWYADENFKEWENICTSLNETFLKTMKA